jgi:death-on-curing protein
MLSSNELIAIHEMLTEWFAQSEDPISPPGIKDRPLLESAAARPYHTVNGKDA